MTKRQKVLLDSILMGLDDTRLTKSETKAFRKWVKKLLILSDSDTIKSKTLKEWIMMVISNLIAFALSLFSQS